MRNIYLSFLGLGDYDHVRYELNGKLSAKTGYVQSAEIEILGKDHFDKFVFFGTEKSMKKHRKDLTSQLIGLGVKDCDIDTLTIEEDMTPEGQWKWFEAVLGYIDLGDSLTLDLTHGFRSTPIVISAAVNFLQKARNITLEAVYYGAYEKDKEQSPIIDMKEFYLINEWADGVSRLTEDADTRKLAEVSEKTPDIQMGELNDLAIIQAFTDLTDTIRNVDIHSVASKANAALVLIREKEKIASVTGKILLKLVMDKFVSLTTAEPPSGKYDKQYFLMQMEIIRLLLEHKLYMQAYTVMREFIGSIGLIPIAKANTRNSEGRQQRNKAELFVRMLQYPESKWDFEEDDASFQKILPFYKELKKYGIEAKLRTFSNDLIKYRNGFDHAWTSMTGAFLDVSNDGDKFFKNLENVIKILIQNNLLI